jgi:hypothetical protein
VPGLFKRYNKPAGFIKEGNFLCGLLSASQERFSTLILVGLAYELALLSCAYVNSQDFSQGGGETVSQEEKPDDLLTNLPF